MTLEVENPKKYNSDPFWGKQGEDSGIFLLKIIGFAPEQPFLWKTLFYGLFRGFFSYWLQIGYTCHLATIWNSCSVDDIFKLLRHFCLFIWIQMTVSVQGCLYFFHALNGLQSEAAGSPFQSTNWRGSAGDRGHESFLPLIFYRTAFHG